MQTSTLAVSSACRTSLARSHVNLYMLWDYCRLHWIISAHRCWIVTLLRRLLYSGSIEMSTAFCLKKLPTLHSCLPFQFIPQYCVPAWSQRPNRQIGRSDFTFAHSTALPTALLINRGCCCCQHCCSLVSSAYSRLYSNQVRLWPSPCKVFPFLKINLFWAGPPSGSICEDNAPWARPYSSTQIIFLDSSCSWGAAPLHGCKLLQGVKVELNENRLRIA